MRILALNAASSTLGAGFGLLDETLRVMAEDVSEGRGGAQRLPPRLDVMFRAVGWPPATLDLIVVVAGPGSFTGLRASLALAHGLALGARHAEVIAVTVGEALAPVLRARAVDLDAECWCVSQARRDRVFIERLDGGAARVEAAMLDALPLPEPSVLLGGDAETLVADRLEQQGVVVFRSGRLAPSIAEIGAAGLARRAALLPELAAQPLYVDAPEAKRPAPHPAA